jgi:hypothetical protein
VDEQTFKALMFEAEALTAGDYLKGYQRGLRRHYHGDDSGTDTDHRHWLNLAGDRDDLGRGYRDGLAGRPVLGK